MIEALTAGSGPVAIDAERASGFKYYGRAYLIQLRRNGSGTFLIDPTYFDDLVDVNAAIADAEWILHAAGQDLPCLDELGMRPTDLFDTELAARLCGFERVNLAALTEKLLGFSLQKQHSASDWSTRPLPPEWLTYAALDVELLVELRDALDVELREQGKREWAAQEFEAVRTAPPPKPRKEPWRRTSGIHKVKDERGLARVRELWTARDEIARTQDRAPSKIVPDPALVDAALTNPTTSAQLLTIPGFQRRHARTHTKRWLSILADVRQAPADSLPPMTPHLDGPPAGHRWASKDPTAAKRLKRARAIVTKLADEHNVPAANLVSPAAVRAVAWEPPRRISTDSVAAKLSEAGARDWQVAIIAGPIASTLRN
ncbi:HRDC domain-containing protein [Stackebrandtia soli]